MEERAVITALLDEKSQDASFQAVMEKYSPVKQGNTQDSNWKKTLKAVESETDRLNQLRDDLLIQLKNEELSNLFSFYNVKNDDLLTGIRECFREYGNVDKKTHSSWRKDPSYPGSPLSFMRQVMSKLGIKAVQPDLIIMDEFQRYDRLLFEREKDSEMDLFAILVKEYEKQTCQPYF